MNRTKIMILAASLVMLAGCNSGAKYEYPFQNPKLSTEERVENLISLLTPEEKVGMMMNKTASIDRLGIPSYNWWSEACHGVRADGYTVYPQPIGMAAAFNPQLMYDVFSTVSDEARANWNRSTHDYFGIGTDVIYYPANPELTFWCPNVNIFRDPRWGRGQETCGEDPYLQSVLGLQTVLGMQGDDPTYYKTHACAKHYAVHSGPEPLRHTYDARVSMRDLWETYLPAFKTLVIDGDVREVMCAYQRYEGVPCCANERLLIDILRNKWGYDGIILTDCDAINNFYTKGQHETHPDPLSAAVDAVLSGTDLECGRVFKVLSEALEKGLISEADLDVHLRKNLAGLVELGFFDPQDKLPWANIPESNISSEEHNALAVQAARESMVLLENHEVLPLAKNLKKIVVVGPNANDTTLLNGEYGGSPTKEHTHSLLDGIRAAVPSTEVVYVKGCELTDEYNTIQHLAEFNGGKGIHVDFYNDNDLKGQPAVSNDFNKALNFSTFGAYGFADGVSTDKVSLRASGSYVPDFTGPLSYTISSDNGYVLKVNGKVVEKNAEAGARRMRRGAANYKTFDVKAGETYNIEIEYKRGNGPFAMFSANFCQRKYADFLDIIAETGDADAIIVISGISPQMEGEGGDKADIELPAVQQRLVKAMHTTGKPVVVVNCSGSAIAFASVEGSYDALLQAWYPGQGGPEALADIIFGDYNPSAKLPVTFYASTDQLPDFLDYSMENRTYRYFHGVPQYAFGYGLSYTTYEYGEASISKNSMNKSGKVTITVPVKNTGKVAGDEIVQVYVKSLDNPDAPIKSLKGFDKVTLAAGASGKAKITLDGTAFEYYDEAVDGLSVRSGKYQILYGSSSRDIDLKAIDFEVK
ncbi:MAG: glycoside hydrolase family 3 C-terminal domain-containing protein [Bacteroidales bacterium]|nr:glycoside hydrolase family 3 C-terminal domain-containing protein [Bacteroidales bacterium]